MNDDTFPIIIATMVTSIIIYLAILGSVHSSAIKKLNDGTTYIQLCGILYEINPKPLKLGKLEEDV